MKKGLKRVFEVIVDEYFPDELEVGERYVISFNYYPKGEDSGDVDNISLKKL